MKNKKLIYLFSLIMISVIIFSGCSSESIISYYNIQGNVRSYETGLPVSGAEVTLENSYESYNDTTGSDGGYSFSNVRKGDYTLTVESSNFSFYEESYNVNSNDIKNIYLRTPSYYDIQVIVKSDDTGYPISGAEVTLENNFFSETKTTGSSGILNFYNIMDGNYTLTVEHSNYQLYEKEYNIESDRTLNVYLIKKLGNSTVRGNITINNVSEDSPLNSVVSSTTKTLNNVSANNNINYTEDNYKKGELIVKYKNTTPVQSVQNLEVKHQLNVLKSLDTSSGEIIKYKLSDDNNVKEMADYYNSLPEVEWAEPNYYRYLLNVPNDDYYSVQWGINNLNLEAAWDFKTNSSDILVAVLDSGINPDHPDLENNLVRGADFVGGDNTGDPSNFDPTDFDPTDESSGFSHGTHVSGIIGAIGNNNRGVAGVNWNVDIMPVRIESTGGYIEVYDEVESIYYSIEREADVINLSLGADSYSDAERTAINDAYNSGIVIVAAAGNDGSSSILYPARYPNTIAVGSVNKYNQLSDFSNYGSNLDFVAPGENIYSTDFYGYISASGTSMATPYVSGIVAMLLSKDKKSPSQIKSQLESTAVDLGSSGEDYYYGYGLVDAYGALLDKKLENPIVFAGTEDSEYIYYRSELKTMEDDGSYELNEVASGEFYIYGWRDVNGNERIDGGDYYGKSESPMYISDSSMGYKDFEMNYIEKSSTTSLNVIKANK